MKNIYHRFPNIPIQIEYRVGCNARENTLLINESNANDIWFHAADHSSCHVIARMPQTTLTKKQVNTIIKMGCVLCKQHTNKLKSEKNIEFNYTKVKYISPTDVDGVVQTENLKSYRH